MIGSPAPLGLALLLPGLLAYRPLVFWLGWKCEVMIPNMVISPDVFGDFDPITHSICELYNVLTWNPNDPCFDWKGSGFGGSTLQKKEVSWVLGIIIYAEGGKVDTCRRAQRRREGCQTATQSRVKEAKKARKKAKAAKAKKDAHAAAPQRKQGRWNGLTLKTMDVVGSWFAVGQGVHGPEAKAKALVAADRQKAKRKEKRAAKRWMLQKGTWTAARRRPSRPQIN